MKTEMSVREIINRCFEEPEFREKLVGDSIEDRRDALAPYFGDDFERLEEALGALNRILDSPSRDSLVEFFRSTDQTVEFAP